MGLTGDASNPGFYRFNNARAYLDKGVTLLAPTSYGQYIESYPIGHDLLQIRFLESLLLDPTVVTVGEAFRRALATVARYAADPTANPDRPWYRRVFSLTGQEDAMRYAYYGTALYGWPNQIILRGNPASPSPMAPGAPAAPALASRIRPASTSQQSATLRISIPAFSTLTDPAGRTVFQAANNSGLFGEPFGPILPVVRRSLALPPGSRLLSITATPQASHPHPVPVDLARAGLYIQPSVDEPTERLLPAPQPTLSNPYPADIYRASLDIDPVGNPVVHLEIIPVQYNPTTRTATLHDEIDVVIEWDGPVVTVTLDSIDVVSATNGILQATVRASSPGPRDVLFAWRVHRADGTLEHAQFTDITLDQGSQNLQFTMDPQTWSAGQKELTVSLLESNTGELLATRTHTLRIAGLSLALSIARTTLPAGTTQEPISVAAFDETGRPITGLSQNLQVELDQSPTPVAFTESSPGTYTGALPLPSLGAGGHLLTIRARDNRGSVATVPGTFTLSTNVLSTVRIIIQRQGSDVLLSWPADATGYALEQTDRLDSPTTWIPAAIPPTAVSNTLQIRIPAAESTRFNRLRKN